MPKIIDIDYNIKILMPKINTSTVTLNKHKTSRVQGKMVILFPKFLLVTELVKRNNDIVFSLYTQSTYKVTVWSFHKKENCELKICVLTKKI